MPASFDNFNSTGVAAVSTATLIHTAAANTVMLVFAGGNGTASVSAMAYGGVPLTQLTQVASSTNPLFIWALTAPAAGANTLSMQSTAAIDWVLCVATYKNVRSAVPFGGYAVGTATGASNFNLSVSCSSTDLVVTAMHARTSTTAGSPQFNNATTRGRGSANAIVAVAVGDAPGVSPTLTLSATTVAATNWRGFAVPLIFSASTANTPSIALTGAGF